MNSLAFELIFILQKNKQTQTNNFRKMIMHHELPYKTGAKI